MGTGVCVCVGGEGVAPDLKDKERLGPRATRDRDRERVPKSIHKASHQRIDRPLALNEVRCHGPKGRMHCVIAVGPYPSTPRHGAILPPAAS